MEADRDLELLQKLQDIQDGLEKVDEEASDKVLEVEVEQKYNEIRRHVYVKRNEVIKSIPNLWLTAVDYQTNLSHDKLIKDAKWQNCLYFNIHLQSFDVQFLSHPVLGDLFNEKDKKKEIADGFLDEVNRLKAYFRAMSNQITSILRSDMYIRNSNIYNVHE